MSNHYITNPTVRALLARQIKYAHNDCARIVQMAPDQRDHWRRQMNERVQSFRLFAIATHHALRNGELKVEP